LQGAVQTVKTSCRSTMKPLSTFSLILRDVWSGLFLRDMFCEFLGTVLFLFISLSSVLLWPHAGPLSWDEPLPTPDSSLAYSPDPLHVSVAFGGSVTLACVCLGEVHLNPVVTLALVAGLRVTPWRAVLLVGAQLLGALSAFALLLGITPSALKSNLGVNEVAPGVYLYQALLVEMAVTFQLVLCVQAATHPKSAFSSLAPAVIGLSVTLGHLVAIGFTGCGMNPARSFGPAVLTTNFHNHWVFWVGPCAGSLLAWLLHDLVLHPRWSCLGDWVTECKETLLKDLSKQSRVPENRMEA
ncbi:aquaporin-1-like, partial [Puntigrus tetrazona]|uniref:aquaporin-1-like n=1 Tax=Puntigrus tetrazona TaxID=1606681 RepID=UPI001C8A675B